MQEAITDYGLTRECEALAKEIFEEGGDQKEMFDRAHEYADSHEYVIYNWQALQLCANCDTSQGESFLDDIGFEWKQGESTIYTIATTIAYGEIRARIETALNDLVKESENA